MTHRQKIHCDEVIRIMFINSFGKNIDIIVVSNDTNEGTMSDGKKSYQISQQNVFGLMMKWIFFS